MFLDHVFYKRESQAGAGSSFGRKEGLKDSRQVLRRYSPAMIREGHPQALPS